MLSQETGISLGYCECGCGKKTPIATRNHTKQGYHKGQPIRFISGHNSHLLVKEKHHRWSGGRKITTQGYVMIWQPEHPKARRGYVMEHILIAEKALGRLLPPKVEIHHFNEIKSDNTPSNLVICPDAAYHKLLHARMRALRACGNPNFRKCYVCGKWCDTSELICRARNTGIHRACNALRQRQHTRAQIEEPGTAPKDPTQYRRRSTNKE